jgi:Ca-activated chloride channel family protein
MSGGKIQSAVDAAISFVNALTVSNGDKAAIISWSSNIISTLSSTNLTSDFPALINLINDTTTVGGTDLNDGLNGAIDLLDADATSSLKVIVFLTDGDGTYTFEADGGPASEAAQKGYRIYAIGLEAAANADNLFDMANATNDQNYTDIESADLQAIFIDIFMDVVLSTIPRSINVEEITLDYIVVDCDSATPPAATCDADEDTSKTTLSWNEIGLLSDGDSTFMADETVT